MVEVNVERLRQAIWQYALGSLGRCYPCFAIAWNLSDAEWDDVVQRRVNDMTEEETQSVRERLETAEWLGSLTGEHFSDCFGPDALIGLPREISPPWRRKSEINPSVVI